MFDAGIAAALSRRRTIGLAALLLVTVVGIGAALAGPGRGAIADVESEIAALEARLETWAREQAAARPATATEREAWALQWRTLYERVPTVRDDSALVASAAAEFDAPSVHALEVAHRAPATGARANDDDARSDLRRLDEPFGARAIELAEVPLRVTFRASYDDALRILERLEAGTIPAHVDALELKRDRPGVHVRVDLTYFTRAAQSERSARDGSDS